MSRPVFHVDFNELLEPDLVLLSRTDIRQAKDGHAIALAQGMPVRIWDGDVDAHGNRDDLIAEGVAMRNTHGGGSRHVRWCCRIDANGIRHQSDIDG